LPVSGAFRAFAQLSIVEQASSIGLAGGGPQVLGQSSLHMQQTVLVTITSSRLGLSQAQAKPMSKKLQSLESSSTYKAKTATHSYGAYTKQQ